MRPSSREESPLSSPPLSPLSPPASPPHRPPMPVPPLVLSAVATAADPAGSAAAEDAELRCSGEGRNADPEAVRRTGDGVATLCGRAAAGGAPAGGAALPSLRLPSHATMRRKITRQGSSKEVASSTSGVSTARPLLWARSAAVAGSNVGDLRRRVFGQRATHRRTKGLQEASKIQKSTLWLAGARRGAVYAVDEVRSAPGAQSRRLHINNAAIRHEAVEGLK